MTLLALLEAVKDQNLDKNQLEQYHQEMTHLHSMMQLELASIEKEEALFFGNRTAEGTTDISIKRIWRVTKDGQRQIELNRFIKTAVKELQSLRSRLYSTY